MDFEKTENLVAGNCDGYHLRIRFFLIFVVASDQVPDRTELMAAPLVHNAA
jgi:hypothetical protein